MSIAKKFTGIGAILCTMGVVGVVLFYDYTHSRSHFDRSLWLTNNTYTKHNPRFHMVEDLMSHHLHSGISRQEVIALLGDPKGESFISAEGVYFYMLGTQYFDPSFLCVEFDRQDRVLKVSRFDR